MTSVASELSRQIIECGLIPIVRGRFTPRQVVAIAETLKGAGINVIEVTLNSSNALESISLLRKEFSDNMLVGAGTVRSLDMFRDARQAGAQFTIAPGFDRDIACQAVADSFLHLPGVLSPTEIEEAFASGLRMVKVFPIDTFGPAYLKAIRAPLDNVSFVPTGGITAENVGEYVRAGASAAGIGSALVTSPEQPLEDLAKRAAKLRGAWDQAVLGRNAESGK